MLQVAQELEYAFTEHYHKHGAYSPEAHCITLCGHISNIIEEHDAYLVYLPRYNFSVQICPDCFPNSTVYTVGTDREWESKVQRKYKHFKFTDHVYIHFGTMEQFQIELELLNKK